MYSGLELTDYSGRLLGAHQKLDRVARRQLEALGVSDDAFPPSKEILRFEGRNGPDGIKVKSPAKDEPWHYYDPFNDSDTEILDIIAAHYNRLVAELKADNPERVAFEAAWLAHALVDGLTPAHHFPYEETLRELRGGLDKESRTTYKEKLIMHGDTFKEKAVNNWRMWGSKGLYASHVSFEIGFATIIKPLTFKDSLPTAAEIAEAQQIGVQELFKRMAREIGVLDMYNGFLRKGWTPRLAYDVRHKLGPIMIKTVSLSWYLAVTEAGRHKVKPTHHASHSR